MKLRIRENSLRLRLTRSEIIGLVKSGAIESFVQLGSQAGCALVYRLELSDAVAVPTTRFDASKICVQIPAAIGNNWAQSDNVGIYGEEKWGLKLVIEKDFKCLDPRLGGDDNDAFEHPGVNAGIECRVISDGQEQLASAVSTNP